MISRRWVLFALFFCAAQAEAHDTWLMAESLRATPGSIAVLHLTSGMAFPALDYAIKTDRLKKASLRLAGKTTEIPKKSDGEKSLQLEAPLPDAGVATVWIELQPKSLEMKPDQVLQYLEEIGADEALQKAWSAETPPGRWRETYTKHAKTFIRVGSPVDDVSWAQPVGLGLEIVPESDPTTLKAGDSLSVKVLKNGAPLPHFAVGLLRESQTHGLLQTTDASGRVTFQLAEAGRWLLRGTELKASTTPDNEWDSHFTTLTFEVLAP